MGSLDDAANDAILVFVDNSTYDKLLDLRNQQERIAQFSRKFADRGFRIYTLNNLDSLTIQTRIEEIDTSRVKRLVIYMRCYTVCNELCLSNFDPNAGRNQPGQIALDRILSFFPNLSLNTSILCILEVYTTILQGQPLVDIRNPIVVNPFHNVHLNGDGNYSDPTRENLFWIKCLISGGQVDEPILEAFATNQHFPMNQYLDIDLRNLKTEIYRRNSSACIIICDKLDGNFPIHI
ncbi:DgyrCDS14914 [Dimorphilus gyrociliatus]|uniref:DgyrCDS14914 n=1 Tax=Dimorphilus gyrociliatus TaxID=2664684 RepID=A0A7I8WFN9_9ANNE|nr:DgyrCDS14914 [Dimorphilus gyrociliatus]